MMDPTLQEFRFINNESFRLYCNSVSELFQTEYLVALFDNKLEERDMYKNKVTSHLSLTTDTDKLCPVRLEELCSTYAVTSYENELLSKIYGSEMKVRNLMY